ncbi:Metallo-beta-lactamase family protein [Fulvivirga imtechensis AK7]|uniref:Metallo-beta-lactamase family protein n=1 Tax=Fulvivirga imtechensis AK7 TaxID=1237149 RepID=L8K1Q4_9BACT|nr:MBL fold metallo-hydrolase [Fulvivirga imtechensis]ELR73387.1 Metallo-beta-lactamase family protein [Fulvivirga imtechensis AK7]
MKVEQIYDKALAHGSYAIESDGKVALVDPGRDPQPYLDFAKKHNGKIVAVFETHPHADFASSHLEFQKKFGADIYVNPKVGVSYEYKPMEHNDEVKIGQVTVRALFTPGHSPDHNSYLLLDEKGKESAVFTGDSLFVGDVGRPDLREGAGNIKVNKKELAGMMFETLQTVFDKLDEDVVVYPAHGAGSLCGKNMSDDLYSTIGREKKENWAFQLKEKDQFIASYLEGQAFIPKYFPYDVELNRKGAESMEESIKKVQYTEGADKIEGGALVIDVRDQSKFKGGHLKGAINIQNNENDKFETWLGSIVGPDEKFYLVADNREELDRGVKRAAKIGYEANIRAAVIVAGEKPVTESALDLQDFRQNPAKYTIVDIRNTSEVAGGKFFENAVNIPLPELRERAAEVNADKPVVVHCAGGYRSAAGASILAQKLNTQVYDLSEAIKEFNTKEALV